ncbi:MAG TPA: hypothetical protein PLM63_03655 [bacterium]|jgi:hypothetical protein|nr:hypothetical protein [bacterium]
MTKKQQDINISDFVDVSDRITSTNSNIIGEVFKNKNSNLRLEFKVNGIPLTSLKNIDDLWININFLKEPQGNKVGIISISPK